MKSKRNYVNPRIIEMTMQILSDYKNAHPESTMPMRDAFDEIDQPESERKRFALAAKRLGWNIVKTRGHIYENGFFVW